MALDTGDQESTAPRDGLIDFRGYTTEQLAELRSSIDSARFPLNYARLTEELKRRELLDSTNSPIANRQNVRFSRSESFWRWIQARRRRQWLYGTGLVEVQPAQIVLTGWTRNWLGMPVQSERRVSLEAIRNVGLDNTTVVVEVAGWLGITRKLEFDCDSAESALSLCERLPSGRGAVFEEQWRNMRSFHRTLYAAGNYPWAATALVLLNVFAYLIFSIETKSWLGAPAQLLTVWGSNYGPLTVGGQWWRLLSSLFLHRDPLHLLLNMWVLWNVGRLAERLFGHWIFLCVYIFTGLVAGLTTIAWNPVLDVVGSSAAIFGLIGAVLASVIRPSHRTPPEFLRSYWLSLLLFTLFNLLSGFLQIGIANDSGNIKSRSPKASTRRSMTNGLQAGAKR